MISPRNIRFVLAAVTILAVIGIVAAISLKGSRTAQPAPVSQNLPQNIDVALRNARFSEMRDGAVVWEMVAERTEYDKTGEHANLSGITIEFPRNDSAGSITVTAATGEYSSKTKNIRLRGKVHAVTESGATFDTETLDYLAERSLFRTTDMVHFRHQRLDLTARGMEMNTKDQQGHFHSPVNATVTGVTHGGRSR